MTVRNLLLTVSIIALSACETSNSPVPMEIAGRWVRLNADCARARASLTFTDSTVVDQATGRTLRDTRYERLTIADMSVVRVTFKDGAASPREGWGFAMINDGRRMMPIETSKDGRDFLPVQDADAAVKLAMKKCGED